MEAGVLPIPTLFGALALLVVAAHLAGFAATRARLPSVVGEVCIGIVLAALPGTFLRSLRSDALIRAFAELGVVLLMFDIGLELRTSDLRRVGMPAFRVATIGIVASVVLVAVASWVTAASGSLDGHVFLGATLAATSMGVTGRILRELGRTQSPEGRTALAAAVLDDVLSLVLLAFVSAVMGGGGPGRESLAVITLRAVGFLAAAVIVGRLALPRVFALAGRVAGDGAPIVFGLGVCLAYAWAASLAGLAPVIGAFCAGLVIQPEDTRPLHKKPGEALEDLIAPLLSFFVPIFFLLAGLQVDVDALREPRAWLVTALILVAATGGKLLAGLGAGRAASRSLVGVAMVPRGEVSLIFATAGLALGARGAPLLTKSAFNAVVITVVATALVPALAFRRLLRHTRVEDGRERERKA